MINLNKPKKSNVNVKKNLSLQECLNFLQKSRDDVNKEYIEVRFCKEVEKHLHEIGYVKPYWLSYELPDTYEYKGKKYRIKDNTTIHNHRLVRDWKPTLFGKIFGTFLFFCYPFTYIFDNFLNRNYTFTDAIMKDWTYLFFTGIFSWIFFWYVPSNNKIK